MNWGRRALSPATTIPWARARTLHLAEGILIGLRRCRAEHAIAELVSAGREAGLSTYALARGLVLATGGYRDTTVDPAARVAEHRWGALLRPPVPPSDTLSAAPTSMA
ncbi:MAG: antitermination regulator [Mycobacterium sp.]|nr:antitermination regulator [Mycobacterium sp.]